MSMSPKWVRRALPLILLPLVAVGCDDDPTGNQNAEITLLLTDDPGEHVDNVWIEIDSIYLQGDGGGTGLFGGEDAEALGLVELTELDDETLTLIEDETIPAGTYGQLRFVIGSAVLEADGRFFSFGGAEPPGAEPDFEADGQLQCPSCTQTGIKAILPQESATLDSDAHVLVLDFDVARSFGREAGASGMWVMSPVIVATELAFSGDIGGTVTLGQDVTIPECPAGEARDITVFQATATAQNLFDDEGNALVFTDHPDANGDLDFAFLAPDTYEMSFASPIDVTDTHQIVFTAIVDPAEVTVASGGDLDVDYTITGATCQEIPE